VTVPVTYGFDGTATSNVVAVATTTTWGTSTNVTFPTSTSTNSSSRLVSWRPGGPVWSGYDGVYWDPIPVREELDEVRRWFYAGDEAAARAEPLPPDPEVERRRQERVAVRALARDRARQTLLSLLPPTERDRYEAGEGFTVRGSAGGEYHVRGGHYVRNVTRTGGGRRVRLCAHPRMLVDGGELPTEDALIAQLLMLRFDEPGFLAIANAEEM